MPSHLLPLPALFPHLYCPNFQNSLMHYRAWEQILKLKKCFLCLCLLSNIYSYVILPEHFEVPDVFSEKESELESRDKPTAPLSGGVCEPCYDFYTFHLRSVL